MAAVAQGLRMGLRNACCDIPAELSLVDYKYDFATFVVTRTFEEAKTGLEY